MATFVKLTSAYGTDPVWVNLDLVREMRRKPAVDNDYQGRAPERTELSFDSGGMIDDRDVTNVIETPEEIAAHAGV